MSSDTEYEVAYEVAKAEITLLMKIADAGKTGGELKILELCKTELARLERRLGDIGIVLPPHDHEADSDA